MTDYKDTLNLPHTAFPMKASLAQREPQRLSNWQAQNMYAQLRTQNLGQPSFVLHDGPPYANGHLHCGHALNKILKDIIVKSKSMSGFDALYVPGWDCHGLPIEMNVEKKVGKVGVKVDAKTFRAHCRDYASSQMAIQRDEFIRLGILADWEHAYATMQFSYEANVVRALAKIIEHGHLQKGFKPVHWCIDCQSSLSEAEVEYDDKQSTSLDVAFIAEDSASFLQRMHHDAKAKPLSVPIWTTTPWTLPANEAVALNAELEYALVDASDRYWLLASDCVAKVLPSYGISKWQVLTEAKGSVFMGLTLRHPLYDHTVALVMSSHVTTDTGTGCVHIAPAHGPDDFLVGLKHGLPCVNPVLGNGCYSASVPLFAGLFVRQVDEVITQTLRKRGVLLQSSTIQHSYPHCWRHKTPLIFRATPQWFISMDNNGLREQLLVQINDVEWIPGWGKARIAAMISERPDWCISRQRAWGTPLPLFVHRSTQALHPNTLALLDDVALRIEQHGIDAWFDLDPRELLGSDADDYEKVQDTLDVWFDSGVSHACVLAMGETKRRADLYLEGSDQHRGWFNSSLTTAAAMYGMPPYKAVLTHGYTVDADGKKLSKSKGNYIALDQVIREHGADILRLWVASTDYRNEVSISNEILKRTADAYRRIRNTARFLLANLFDYEPKAYAFAPHELVELDRWILKRSQMVQAEIVHAYEQYNFHLIYQKLHNFCVIDLSSFYLDVVKDRQYTNAKNSQARRSCQFAMHHILQALTRWIAPILSFTAEEIHEVAPGYSGRSILLERWYGDWPIMADDDVDMPTWDTLYRVRDEVNKALENQRQSGVIGSALAAEVYLYVNDTRRALLQRFGDELRFVMITSAIKVLPWADCPTDAVVVDDMGIVIHASEHAKCARCWHRCESVDLATELCTRCAGNISEPHEIRRYA